MSSAGSGSISTNVRNPYLYSVNDSKDVTHNGVTVAANLNEGGYPFFGSDGQAASLEQNGRLNDLFGADSYKPKTKNNNSFEEEAIKGIHSENGISKIFFSNKNIEYIQATIRYSVYQKTKKTISDQDPDAIKIIMRSMYLQYSQNLSCKFKQQLDHLNYKVVEYCVPQVLSGMEQYVKYLKDITTMPEFINRPVNVSSKGEKTYSLDYFI